MSANRTFDLSEASNLFKIKYGKLSENVYNSANVLLGRVKKEYNFVGKQMSIPVPQSFSGGVGSGSLPKANVAIYSDAQLTRKKVYAVVQIDRESIAASMNDEGAFVRATKEVVKKGVESWMRNMSRILFGNGTGQLAAGDAATNVTGAGSAVDPYIVVLASTTKDANIEERDLWNYDSETTLLEVAAYDPDTKTVQLVGTSAGLAALVAAPGPMLANKYFFMQNSAALEPEGLYGVLRASAGSKYGISIARRWKSFQKNAAAAAISTDLLNHCMLNVEKQCGKSPNLIITSYKQYEKILNLLEDQKQYNIDPRSPELKGKISFKGVEFMSSQGPVGIFPERFMEDDQVYFLNDEHIVIHHAPKFGWFDDDGTVFLRVADTDAYEARYGGYLQVYVNPCFHGVLYGLA